MSRQETAREIQRTTFVDNLYASLRKKTAKVINEHNKFISLANSYINDGLNDEEAIELLIVDGLTREAAESYVEMSKTSGVTGNNQYSFMFKDASGRIWSSNDVGKNVVAKSYEEARDLAAELLDEGEDLEGYELISVEKIKS